MDSKTGQIYKLDSEEARRLNKETKRRLIPLTESENIELTSMANKTRKNWMRNRPCICGSGKKFKRCCWSKYE